MVSDREQGRKWESWMNRVSCSKVNRSSAGNRRFLPSPIALQLLGLCVLILTQHGTALAQGMGWSSGTNVLVVRIPPRGRVAAPKTLSTLGPIPGSNLFDGAGLIDVAMRTTRATGNGILTAEWSAREDDFAASCATDSLNAGIMGRSASVLDDFARLATNPGPRKLKLSLRWDPQMPYREQWASVTSPRLPVGDNATSQAKATAPPLARVSPAELAAERTVTPGVAVPLLTVRPGQSLTEGRFYASASLPDTSSVFASARPGSLTLTITEY